MKKLISIVLLLAMCLTAFAACGTKGPSEELIAAGDYLFGLYKDDPTTTAADYDVAGRVMVGTVAYDVAWTVDVTEGVTIKASEKSGFMTIDVNEKTENEIAYTLTATITDENGDTVQKTFQRTVPAYKVFSYAEYAAAANGDTVVVKGVITGIFSKTNGSSGNGVYIQDMNNEGGYYVYGLADGKDPEADLGLKVGMTVEAVGQKDTYNGLYEIISATFEILDANVKALEPVDYTEIFASAEALTDAALVGKQSLLVTVKGVEITGQDTGSGYYKFALGGKETYVRISSSNNCITKDEQAAFIAAHTENFGYVADVTGIIQLYNGSFYLIPVTADAFANCALPERSDAEKIEMEVGNITIADRITEDTEIELAANGTTYPEVTYAWESDNACAVVADGKLTITLPEEDATVTLTLTVTCGEQTETKTYTLLVNSASTDLYLPEKVEDAVADTAYKFVLTQNNLGGANLYFAGYMSGNYLATTDKADKAVDVTLEAVEGGFRMFFMDGEAKKYIDIYEYTAGKVGVQLTETPTCVYTYNAELGIWTANVAGGDYYLGTYKTYNTISASSTSYINAENKGVSQFPCEFATLKPATYVAQEAEAVADGSYKFALIQNNLNGTTLYFAGYMSGNYLATTDKADKAVDVTLEAVEGGFRMFFMDGEAKKYIDIYEYTAGKVGVQLTETPTCVYTYNAELGIWTANVAGGDYYLGTYKTYNTISASSTSYINAENKGVSQFPCGMFTLKLVEVAPVEVAAPEADTAYKFALTQNNLGGANLYFAGYMSGNYLATTDKISKATDTFVEAVEGGIRFYFLDGETKKYVDVYEYTAGKVGVQLTEAPTAVYTYDAELGIWVAAVAGDNYYLGTYKTYNTISASKTSYVNAENKGVSQFPCAFVTIEVVE